jgi:NAD dependent epimerase/dehydratase family enzyme
MSWILLDEVIAIVKFALLTEALQGPINVVSPFPVTNEEFTKILGKVLNRPTVLPVPAFALKLIFGSEMADELLLSGARVEPQSLRASGYSFLHPQLEKALASVFKG